MKTLSWTAVMVMLTASPVVGAELLVPDGYPTVQAAVSAAADSDVVVVAPGLYALDSPLDFLGKAIRVRSVGGPELTRLHFSSSFGVVFQSGESRDTAFEGFTVTGVGILCDGASPTIRDVHVEGLSSTGIGIRGAPPHPEGAFLEHCSVRDCVTTSSGGGIAISAPAVLDTCVIEDNECDGSPPLDGYGAGIFIESSSGVVVVRNCLIRGNRNLTGVVGVGGGIWARGTNLSIENCTITENESTAGGGGAYVLKCAGQVVSTIATGNSTTGIPGQLVITSSTVDVSYCNVEGGAPGVGNIDAPPQFVSGPLGDYYLAATSPCIDAGPATRSRPSRPVPLRPISLPTRPRWTWATTIRSQNASFAETATKTVRSTWRTPSRSCPLCSSPAPIRRRVRARATRTPTRCAMSRTRCSSSPGSSVQARRRSHRSPTAVWTRLSLPCGVIIPRPVLDSGRRPFDSNVSPLPIEHRAACYSEGAELSGSSR